MQSVKEECVNSVEVKMCQQMDKFTQKNLITDKKKSVNLLQFKFYYNIILYVCSPFLIFSSNNMLKKVCCKYKITKEVLITLYMRLIIYFVFVNEATKSLPIGNTHK